jgi:hypothetical protein
MIRISITRLLFALLACSCGHHSSLTGDSAEEENGEDVFDSGEDIDAIEEEGVDVPGDVFWARTYWRHPGFARVHSMPDGRFLFQIEPELDIWLLDYRGEPLSRSRIVAFPGGLLVRTTLDGTGLLLAGATEAFGLSTADALMARLAVDGSVIWQKQLGGIDGDTFSEIFETDDGNYVAVGLTRSWGEGEADFWVVRMDRDGNILWQKTYGSAQEEVLVAAAAVPGGGCLVVGSSVSGGIGILVFRVSADGELLWEKTYPYEPSRFIIGISHIESHPDGGFYSLGHFIDQQSSDESWDLLILRLDDAGSVIWQKRYGSPMDDSPSDIEATSDGGFVVAAEIAWAASEPTVNTGLLMKLDAAGNIAWQKTYGGGGHMDGMVSVAETPDGGLIAGGWTSSFGDPGDFPHWVLKMDGNGEISDTCPAGIGEDASLEPLDVALEPVDVSVLVTHDTDAVVQDASLSPAPGDLDNQLICSSE